MQAGPNAPKAKSCETAHTYPPAPALLTLPCLCALCLCAQVYFDNFNMDVTAEEGSLNTEHEVSHFDSAQGNTGGHCRPPFL